MSQNRSSRGLVMPKKVLYEALHLLKENIQVSQTCEASKYVIFHDGRVCAMDDTIFISIPIYADLSGFAVDMQLIYDFIRRIPDKEFLIGLCEGNLKIKGKNTVASFATRDDVLYDDSLINLDTSKFTKLPAAFGEALSFTGFATDQQDYSYSSCVIHEGYMYALSSYRCARYYMGDEAVELFPGMTFVTPACTTFVNKMRPTRYLLENGMLHLYDKDMRIYSARTRTDNNFPLEMVAELLQPSDAPTFKFPSNLAEVLERCNPFSGTDREVKKVYIKIADGTLNVQAMREDGSRCKEQLLGVMTPEPVSFVLNIDLLTDMLRFCENYQITSDRIIGTASGYVCTSPLSVD